MTQTEVHLVGDDSLGLLLAVSPETGKRICLDQALGIPNVVGGEVIFVADYEAIDVFGCEQVPTTCAVASK